MKIFKYPTVETKTEAVILANGVFPTHEIALSILNNNNYIVCCDGAINSLSHTQIKPQAIVGDCDSLSDENKLKYQDIIIQIKEQETNDLTKSVQYCIEQGKKNLIILGGTGKREDHSIANIGLLADYIEYIDDICMITNHGVFNAINTPCVFEAYPGQQISLFSISPCEVTTDKLKYPIQNRIFTNWWQATLNEAESDTFTIETTGRLIVFRSF